MNFRKIKSKNIRNSSFELLRILCMLLIIMYHFSVCHSEAVRTSSLCFNQIQAFIFGSWGMLGVDCFFIMSAWFLQEKRDSFKSEKLLRIAVQTAFYSLLLLYIGQVTGFVDVEPEMYLEAMISIVTGNYWYIRAYCIMYILAPFLNKIIKAFDKKSLKKMLILLTIIFPVLGFIIASTPICDVGLAIYIYLLVGWLKQEENNIFEKYRYIGAAVTFSVVVIGEIVSSVLGFYFERFCGRYAGFQILFTIFVFYIFKNLTIRLQIVSVLAKSTLVVYFFMREF